MFEHPEKLSAQGRRNPSRPAPRTRRRWSRIVLSVALTAFSALVVAAAPVSASAGPDARQSVAARAPGGIRETPSAPTINVGVSPNDVAVDPRTHTAYVANGVDNTVSVINTRTCSALVVSGCGQHPPTVRIGPAPANGPGPVEAAVDQATDTVYVVSPAGNTVSVIDGRTCNADVRSGCGQTPVLVTVGQGPDGVVVDQATDTIYVANSGPYGNDGDTVSVIDGVTCHAGLTTGCGQTPPTVRVGFGPVVPAVDEATNTIYVPNSNYGGPGSVSMINGTICDAQVTSGCDQTTPSIPVGTNTFPDAAAVDPTTDTVYEVAGGPSLGSVYVINGAICNSRVTSGCGQSAPTVTVGSVPNDVVVNPRTHSVFVANQEDSTLSVLDGTICNATRTAGCRQHPPVVATGFEPGYLDVDRATDTVYVANQDESTVSVINGAACTLDHQAGCRHPAPTTTVGTGPQGIAVNQATGTVYVASQNDNTLAVVDAAACNAENRRGCDHDWPTVATGPTPQAVAVDQRTDTVYTADLDFDNGGAGTTVSVIDGATCNARTRVGCDRAPKTVTVGDGPDALAVNDTTDTIYVADGNTDTISVIDGATCNAAVSAGCSRAPATVTVGQGPDGVAVDDRTDTIYVSDNGGNTVSVINGATCNAAVTTGCGQTPATVDTGRDPNGIALDPVTHTLYVENTGDSTVSVVNAATCNATRTSGCSQTPPTMATGAGAFVGVAVDPLTDTVAVGSVVQSAVDVYNGATCNASVTTGCGQQPVAVPTGGWPSNVAIDIHNGTVYAPDNVDGRVSLFSVHAR